MPVRAGGKIAGVRYAGSKTYVPIFIENLDIPILVSVTNNNFVIEYLPSLTGVLSIIVTSMSANQPSDSAFDASIESQSVTAYSTIQLTHFSSNDPDKSKVWVQLINDNQRITSSVTVEYLVEVLSAFFGNNF